MDADERDICLYLRSWPGQYVGGREISRRAAGKRKFREDPNWAAAAISRLLECNYLESDTTGHYRLRKRERTRAPGRWVSPRVKGILRESGKDFSQVVELGELEDYYADEELKSTVGV